MADTIMEKASDWTSSKPLLMALLQRLLHEMALPYSNQIIMSVLKHASSMVGQHDKVMSFLRKNHLNDVDLLFQLLIFWSRNIWKRSKLSEDNCEYIRKAIINIMLDNSEEKTKLLKGILLFYGHPAEDSVEIR